MFNKLARIILPFDKRSSINVIRHLRILSSAIPEIVYELFSIESTISRRNPDAKGRRIKRRTNVAQRAFPPLNCRKCFLRIEPIFLRDGKCIHT